MGWSPGEPRDKRLVGMTERLHRLGQTEAVVGGEPARERRTGEARERGCQRAIRLAAFARAEQGSRLAELPHTRYRESVAAE